MTRHVTAGAVLLALGALIAWDLAASQPPNPWRAPPFVALGSDGAAPTAHCAALPAN